MTHELKTWEEYFKEVWEDRKTFEIRINDRDFRVGDILVLKEYCPDVPSTPEPYSGREIRAVVTYILEAGQFGVKTGFVVMSIKVLGKTGI